MKIGEYCKHGVVTAFTTADIVELASTMRDQHVGFLVVLEEGDARRTPRGVVTDRDLVVQVCARDLNHHELTAADVMTREPLTACESDDLHDVVQQMRLAGFRRVPVVTHDGALMGIFAIDDAVDVIAGLLCDVCGSIRNEQRQERRLRVS